MFLARAADAIPGGGAFDRLRTSLPAHCATISLALHGGLGADLLASPQDILRHFILRYETPARPMRAEQARRYSLKVVVPVHAVKSSPYRGSIS